jgi:hypothetical protein
VLAHAKHAYVQRDVARAIGGLQSEVSERKGNGRTGMIADQEERRGAPCVEQRERRRIIRAQ